jgi:hypothetical protein
MSRNEKVIAQGAGLGIALLAAIFAALAFLV